MQQDAMQQNGQPPGNVSPEQSDVIAARDAAFARMFKAGERIWRVGEHYNEHEAVWRVDFVLQGPHATWMYHRYHYDTLTGVIYFMGARPVDDEELSRLRRAGTRVYPTE